MSKVFGLKKNNFEVVLFVFYFLFSGFVCLFCFFVVVFACFFCLFVFLFLHCISLGSSEANLFVVVVLVGGGGGGGSV